MEPLYQVVKSGRTITVEPVDSEQTEARQIIFSQRENQIGAYREGRDIRLPAHALTRDADNKWLEYFDPRDSRYYRTNLGSIFAAIGEGDYVYAVPVGSPLEVRHSIWPGRDETEIRLAIQARLARKRKARLDRIRAMVAAEKARLERERIEKEMESRILAEMLENQPTEEEQLAEDLANFSPEDREIYESLQDAA